jgi:hypothetical protein
MSEPSSLLGTLDKASAPLVGVFVVASAMAVAGYYAGVPGFSLLATSAVGMLTFGGSLAVLVLGMKWLRARQKIERVKKRFAQLSERQRNFLEGIRASGKSWFKGYAEDQPWFKELEAFGYFETARPFILVPGEPWSYQLTDQGVRELDRASRTPRDGRGISTLRTLITSLYPTLFRATPLKAKSRK